MIAEEIGLKWARRIALAFVAWAEEEQKSRTIKIRPFDPTEQITLAFYEAGEAQLADIGKLIGMSVKFDLRSPDAEAWIEKYSAKQIKYISSGQKDAIKRIKLIAFQDGLTIQQQRTLIKEHIGLLPNHITAVRTYRDGLIKSGTDEATADKMAAKYRDKLLRYRANMIAETEGMAASNAGTTEANLGAIKRGIIKDGEYKEEIVASGLGNVCDRCHNLDGKRFEVGKGPTLPIHPHCHCGKVLVSANG